MVKMNVPYVRPDKASLTLWNEVAVRYGAAAQNKGFVTGYKAPGNITSHNADANGITHAVDIGVDIEGDGTGIPVNEAEAVALQIIRSGKAKYVIYNRRIASVNTGWEWWAYNGASPHLDHIHVSTAWDYAWGDPCPTPASETDSTTAWGIGTIQTAGGGTIQPIEDDIMASIEELANLLDSRVDEIARRTNAQHVETRSQNESQHIKTREDIEKVTQAQADVTRGYLADRIKESSPEDIVASIPADIAQQVLDGLAARLVKEGQ